MKKVIVVAGPTASGKSSFAVDLALRLGGEVISGDSIQVYRGCDIGSGKITEKEKKGVVHHLIDILSPFDHYSTADFQRMARAIIDASERPQIICGGTGLYLKSCLYDYSFEQQEESIDPELDRLDTPVLYEMLQRTDPVQAEKIHPHNRQRILRSLTIQKQTGRKQSDMEAEQTHQPVYDIFTAGCTMERPLLYERINSRVDQMFADGLVEEVSGLLEEGVTFDNQCMHGIGYHEFEAYEKKEMNLEEVKAEIQKHSRQFAKRQYTWFHHQMEVHWFNPLIEKEREDMMRQIEMWWKEVRK